MYIYELSQLPHNLLAVLLSPPPDFRKITFNCEMTSHYSYSSYSPCSNREKNGMVSVGVCSWRILFLSDPTYLSLSFHPSLFSRSRPQYTMCGNSKNTDFSGPTLAPCFYCSRIPRASPPESILNHKKSLEDLDLHPGLGTTELQNTV